MELEQLKTVWKKTTRQEVEGYFVSLQEVQNLIKKRSNTAVSQIKRGVRNKVLMAGSIGTLMLLFSLYVFVSKEPVFTLFDSLSSPAANIDVGVFYLVFGLVIGSISVFNAFSYKQILDVEKHETDLKSSIVSVLAIIKKAVRAKIYSDTVVVPLTILIIVIVDLVRGYSLFPDTTVLLLTVLGAIVFAAFSYHLTKYGQKKRYGEQIETLEKCLQELEE